MPSTKGRGALDPAGQHVHAGRADEVADEGVRGTLEQLLRRAGLHHRAVVHDHDLVGEGQRLGLVVGHVDHGDVEGAVDLLEGRAQLPFQVRVDDGERLVEQDRGDVGPHQAAPERDLLLHVGREVAGLAPEHRREVEKACDLRHAGGRRLARDVAVLEREGEVLAHRHGVVDHRELEDLGDVARLRRQVRHVPLVEQDAPAGRAHQPRDDVEKRRLAAAGGTEQRVGAALGPDVVDLLQGVVLGPARVRPVGVGEMIEGDAGHAGLSRGSGEVGGHEAPAFVEEEDAGGDRDRLSPRAPGSRRFTPAPAPRNGSRPHRDG